MGNFVGTVKMGCLVPLVQELLNNPQGLSQKLFITVIRKTAREYCDEEAFSGLNFDCGSLAVDMADEHYARASTAIRKTCDELLPEMLKGVHKNTPESCAILLQIFKADSFLRILKHRAWWHVLERSRKKEIVATIEDCNISLVVFFDVAFKFYQLATGNGLAKFQEEFGAFIKEYKY